MEPNNNGPNDQTKLGAADFLKIAFQLALITVVIHQFEIKDRSFWNLFWIVLGGFALHSFLPPGFRLSFFLLLSLSGFVLILGKGAFWLIGIGLGLIGICHLPIRFVARVALLIAAGILLALLRSGVVSSPVSSVTVTFLASLFMFRLILYVYDLKHEKGPRSFREILSYFFLLPNACFAFFPVIDWKVFRRTYYNDRAAVIYQTGVDWILKGITHLLFYRLLYHHFTLAPTDVAHAGDLIRYIVVSFLLYVQVSGQFHLIVGILHLFGFNLPKTHYLYFLVPNFAEVWRCLNIYWKDFMMKIFYYPTFFRFRKKGTRSALVLSTICVFAATCVLHAYQWFWLIGNFPLKPQDLLFWGTLGGLVLWNLLKQPTEKKPADLSSLKGIFGTSVAITRTFLILCILWSLWNSHSVSEWLSMLGAARNQWWYLFLLVPSMIVAFMALVYGTKLLGIPLSVNVAGELLSPKEQPENPFLRVVRRPGFVTTFASVFLISAGLPVIHGRMGFSVATFVQSLQQERLNIEDTELFTKGYYERLIGVERMNMPLVDIYVHKPMDDEEAPVEEPDETELRESGGYYASLTTFYEKYKDVTITDADCDPESAFMKEFEAVSPDQRIIIAIARPTDDFLLREPIPYAKFCVKGKAVNLNSSGLRDREYSRNRPNGTYRIALMGSSHVFGAGISEPQIFPAVFEEMLNRNTRNFPYDQYEILNFSLIARDPFQHLITLERDIFQYDPNAIFFIAMGNDIDRSLDHLTSTIRLGIKSPYQYIEELYQRTKITADTPYRTAKKRLKPFRDEITGWIYREIVRLCKKNGVTPIWIFLPRIDEREPYKEMLFAKAKEAGFTTVDLSGLYEGHEWDSLVMGPLNDHPNPRAHLLIAERLYREFRSHQQLKQLVNSRS